MNRNIENWKSNKNNKENEHHRQCQTFKILWN